jgi:hypothetical protein
MSTPLALVADERYAGWHRPAEWEIAAIARCRGCGRVIAWARTTTGRSAPLDRDGRSHFITCPQAARFRRSRRVDP